MAAAGAVHMVHASVGEDPHQAELAFGRRAQSKLVTVIAIDDTTASEKTVALLHLLGMSSSQQDKAATVEAGGAESCAHVVQASSEAGVRALAAALLARLCQLRVGRQRLAEQAPEAVATLISMAGEDDEACRHAAADVLSTLASFSDSQMVVVDADGGPDGEDSDGPPALERLVRTFPRNVRLAATLSGLCGQAARELLACGAMAAVAGVIATTPEDDADAYSGARGSGRPPAPLPRGYASAVAAPMDAPSLARDCLRLVGRLCLTRGGVEAAVESGAAASLPRWLEPDRTTAQRVEACGALAAVLDSAAGGPALASGDVFGLATALSGVLFRVESAEAATASLRALEALLRATAASGDRGRGAYEGVAASCASSWEAVRAVMLLGGGGAGEDAEAAGEEAARALGPPAAVAALSAVADPAVPASERGLAASLLASLAVMRPDVATPGSVEEAFAARHALGHSDGRVRAWGPSWGEEGAAASGLATMAQVTGVSQSLLEALGMAAEAGDDAAVMRLGLALGALARAAPAAGADARRVAAERPELRGRLLAEGGAVRLAPELAEVLRA